MRCVRPPAKRRPAWAEQDQAEAAVAHRPDKDQLFDGGARRRNRWKWWSFKVRVDLGEMVFGSDKEPKK